MPPKPDTDIDPDEDTPAPQRPEDIAFVKHDRRTSVHKVFARGKRIISYRSEANAKHLARYINELNAQLAINPEDSAKILASSAPGPFPDPADRGE